MRIPVNELFTKNNMVENMEMFEVFKEIADYLSKTTGISRNAIMMLAIDELDLALKGKSDGSFDSLLKRLLKDHPEATKAIQAIRQE